jgi:redox-regulated HSP33 family molecular chaperone
MIRTTTAAAALALAFLATSANAADIVVQTAGKSPAEIRTAIAEAAHKACVRAYANDYLSVYKTDTCVADTIADAMGKVKTVETAMNTRGSN